MRLSAPARGAAALAASLSAAALLLAGCSGTAPAAPALPDGVEVTLVQLRADVAPRQAQVQIVNGTDAALEVGAVRVDDARLDGSAERVVPGDSRIAPGQTLDVRVQLPAVACDVGDDGAATVTLELAAGEVTVPVDDPLGFLPPLHARECLADALAGVADLELTTFTPAPAGQLGSVVLSVTPTGAAGSVHLGAVDSTPLLMYVPDAPAAPHPLDVDVTAASAAADIVIPLVPQRCDPHVVQEDKRGTIFTIGVTVDGVAGEIDLAAPGEMKARMLTWVADWCGFGSG
ncbi:hypothetical protein ACIQLJ_10985 [Microbacterium sp. NPDC091313]